MITPETLTDADILKLGRQYRDGTGHDSLMRAFCIRALGLSDPGTPQSWIDTARQRICLAINARAAKETP